MKRINGWQYTGNTTDPNNPIWDEYQNLETGEKTMNEYKPIKISKYDTCKHYFEMIDDNNACCRKCGFGQRIIWGLHKLKNGKISTIRK